MTEKKPNFEQLFNELETITNELKASDTISLEQAIAKYKKGNEIIKILENLIKEAEELVNKEDNEAQ